jgi:hypothetical protein
MAITTITDLPCSFALDYKALSAIRGGGAGDWVMYAFDPYRPPTAAVVPVINFYQQINNYVATNLTLQTENINVQNTAANAAINVGALQNALTANVAPVLPHT